MQIYLNGVKMQIPEGLDMAGLITLLALTDQRIAVEVNEALVPRSTFPGHPIRTDDRVEIIHAVGGG